MAYVTVRWFDDEIACVECACGAELIISVDPDSGGNRCDSCGRCYRLIQRVELVEPDPATSG